MPRITASVKVLRDKAFNTAENQKPDEYEKSLASMVYECFDKKASGGAVKIEVTSNQPLAEQSY